MLSHPLTLSQSEEGRLTLSQSEEGRELNKAAMAPPPESPLAENSALGLNPALLLAEEHNTESLLDDDSSPEAETPNTALPLAEASTQTASSVSPQMSPQMSPSSSPHQMSPSSSPPQMSPSSSPPQSRAQMPPGPCVLCSSVLPRLLSSLLSLHQKEMKCMIEGALVTVNKRLSDLERRLNELNEDSEGEEPEPGPSQSGKKRRRREEKKIRRKQRRTDQSEQSSGAEDQSEQSVCAVAGQNGLIAPLFRFSSVSHEPLGHHHGDHRTTVMSWMMYSLRGHTPIVRLPWRLSPVAVETAVCLISSEIRVRPECPLQDYTAPPYISSDHSYVRLSAPSLVISARRQQQRHRSNHSARRRPLPLPPTPINGLTASLTTTQSDASSDLLLNKKDGKRVSQIRIRRASPKESNLTPMGLPKVKRLRKKVFSLEEIYTNKNYKSPSVNSSSLETIFEEPREKNGALLLIGQQRRRRVLQFPDFTQPRKRKRPPPPGMGLITMAPRKRAAARRGCQDDDCDSDVMLLQRLSALQHSLQSQGLDS